MRRQQGSVFVYTLVVLVALIGVLAAVASTERLDIKASSNRKEKIKARMACMGAIQRYIATIATDLQGGGATTTSSSSASTSTIAQTTGATTLQDDWAQQLGMNGDENVIVGDTTFRMQVVDACSFINLSPNGVALTTAWLTSLPLSQEQIDALSDFTTPGENGTADGGKDPYYNGLDNPYNAKLAPLDTLDELLQVRYFNAAAVWEPNTNVISTVTYTAGTNGQQPTLYDLLTPYSYSPNVRPGPLGQQTARINISNRGSANLQARLAQLGLSSAAINVIMTGQGGATMGSLMRQVASIQDRRLLLDDCTFNPASRVAGLINLNTASQNVLAAVPNINPDVAQALVTQQATGFTAMSDCLNVAGYSGTALYNTIDYFCVESDTFIVRCIGYCGTAAVAMEATVDITGTTPQLIRIADVPFTDIIGRWNWDSATTTDTILKEAS